MGEGREGIWRVPSLLCSSIPTFLPHLQRQVELGERVSRPSKSE